MTAVWLAQRFKYGWSFSSNVLNAVDPEPAAKAAEDNKPVVVRLLFQMIETHRVFGSDFLPDCRGKLVEQQHGGLPALRPRALRVMLVAADEKTILEIGEELQPLRLDGARGAIRQWRGLGV